jgi:hypothetical protein
VETVESKPIPLTKGVSSSYIGRAECLPQNIVLGGGWSTENRYLTVLKSAPEHRSEWVVNVTVPIEHSEDELIVYAICAH